MIPRYSFTRVNGQMAGPMAPRPAAGRPDTVAADADSGHGPAAGADAAVFWDAVAQVGEQLVDVLTDEVDRARARQMIADQVRAWAHERAATGAPMPTAEAQQRVARAVYDRRYGLGVLQRYLEHPDVENIAVNGSQQTWVTYTDGRKEPGPAVAGSDEELIEWIQVLARRGNTGREFSAAHPLLDVALDDGVRLAAVAFVARRPHLALRVHRLVDITLTELCEDYGTISPGLAEFLAAAVRARRNLVVTGDVNVGKTTLLRALANELDPAERVVTLESDFELFLDDPALAYRHHDVVPLEERRANAEGAGGMRLQDLVPASLRLNPDRVLVGEARHGELAPMLEIMYSGAKGSMCTLHVNRPEQVFLRVVQLGRRAGMGLTPDDLHGMVGLAEPLIIHLTRDPHSNARYVSHVMEVGPPGDGTQPTRNHVYVPGRDGRATPAGHISDTLVTELGEHGFDPAWLHEPAFTEPAGPGLGPGGGGWPQ